MCYSYGLYVGLTCVFGLGSEKKEEKKKEICIIQSESFNCECVCVCVGGSLFYIHV